MSIDSSKTILLEKKYLYVRASLGFKLEGTSTEIIPTNNGFYRFYIDNLSKALGNSYVNILYDSKDLAFQSFCSDLYMDELMSSDSSAIEDVVLELKKNTSKIEEFENGVSSALQSNHEDNVATVEKINEFQAGVSSALASNHQDNVALYSRVNGLSDIATNLTTPSFKWFPNFGNVFTEYVSPSDFVKSSNGSYVATFKRTFDISSSPYSQPLSGSFKFALDFGFNPPARLTLGFSQKLVIYDSTEKRFILSNASGTNSTSSSNSYVTICSTNTQNKQYIASYLFSVTIPSELYNLMVFRSKLFSDRYSFSENSVIRGSSYMDAIYLDIEPNLNSCVFSHKLDIRKKFDSVQDYNLAVFAPTSLSTTFIDSISKIYVIVNGQEKSFDVHYSKTGNSSFPTFYIYLTGENFYHITSISFDSVF